MNKDKNHINEIRRKYYQKNKERVLENNRNWVKKNRKSVTKAKNIYYKNNKGKHNGWAKKSVDKLKKEVFEHYSNDLVICNCCGESEIKFLAIDHINGDGNKERKNTKSKGGQKTYRWLRKNGYPLGYQVLCHNCNMAKGFYGICPHKQILNEI